MDIAGGYLAVSGSLAAARRAFGVRFARYRLAGQGLVRAPEQAVSVPAAVAASVLDVTGLSTARQTMRRMTVRRRAVRRRAGPQAAAQQAASAKLPPPGPNYWVARPCGSYYNQKIATSKPTAYGRHWPWAVCGYTPRQVRGVYGVTASRMTGAGQTVAIVNAYASPTMLSDANTYARVVGDQPFAPGQYQQYLPPGSPTRARISATPRAGTASRRWTWSRCTAWRRTRGSGSWPRPAATTPTWPTPWPGS